MSTDLDPPRKATDDRDGGYESGWADGYAAGIRDAAQPTRHQPVAGELVALQIIPYGGGDTRER